MISENKYIQYGFPRSVEDIKGITLHETGNYEMNAQQMFDYLNTSNRTSQGVHYLVDSEQTIQVMPDNWAVYHTGKGIDNGVKYTIAIEICSSLSDSEYLSAEERAISLIKQLQSTYNIADDNIYFHQDWNKTTYCPRRALDTYGTSRGFVYDRIKGGSE